MATGEVKVKRWNRDEFHRLAEAGFFEGQRSELIQGEIFLLNSIPPRHAMVISLLAEQLSQKRLPQGFTRVRMPLALDNLSEPEPDLAVVSGNPKDYLEDHPSSALLVIEVSETSLQHDRETKSLLYAQSGIQEYWLVDLIAQQVEVRTQPSATGYGLMQPYHAGEKLAPLMAPEALIAVADILP